MSIIGNPIMAGASGPAASIFVTGLSETDSVSAAHKKTVQVPNPDYVGLPDEYTQLEYIESTGTQYIDLGYSTSNAATLAKMSFEVTCAYYDIGTGSTAELLNGNGNAYLGFSAGKFYVSWGRDAGILTDSNIVSDSLMHTWLVDTNEKVIKFDDTIVESNVNFTGVANSYGTLYLFGYQPSSLNNCRIASAKLKYNNEYVRNLVSAKRNSDNIIGLYDLVNNVFYTNAGTGTFTAGSEIPAYIEMTVDDKTLTGKWTQKPNPVAHGLPDGYTELEYIESTGTQYIDTGLTGLTSGWLFEAKMRVLSEIGGWQIFFGSQGYNGANSNWFAMHNSKWAVAAGEGLASDSNAVPVGSDIFVKATTIKNAGALYQDGELVASCTGSKDRSALSLYMFCDNNNGDAGHFSSVRFYGPVKVWSDENKTNLIGSFIPSKRNSDSAIGMYDLVSGTFLENSGTGTFTAGSEIPQTIDGFLIKPIRDLGTWTVTATDGVHTKTQDVLVDVITEYVIEMDYKLWLYRDGDEFKDVTGGWVDDTPNNGWTSVPHIKNEDNLELSKGGSTSSYPECCVFCSNAVDITNYATLHMVVDYKLVNNGMDGVWFGLNSTHPVFLPDNTDYMFKSWDVADETSKEFTFNITSLSGLYYLQAAIIRGAILRIRKAWLE